MNAAFTATVSADSPRRARWLRVFGSACVPIQSGEISSGFYWLDVARLKPKYQRIVITECSISWKLPIDEAKRRVMGDGVPIAPGDDLLVVPGEGSLF